MAKRKREANDAAQQTKALKSRKNGDAPSSPRPNRTAPPQKPPVEKQREGEREDEATITAKTLNGAATISAKDSSPPPESTTFQIITGSYERVLHGFTATIPSSLITGPTHDNLTISDLKHQPKVDFTDTFLFNAHASAIRCLALSPPSAEASKVLLATGSTDERINIYSLSKIPPAPSSKRANEPKLPSLHSTTISENAANKEMGSLLHHSSTITALHFPTRSKLLSASEDSTIAITRTRDWEPLSTIKAPIPKAQGRPSGDTAAPGEVPAGINAFAVHPSMKLMLSVSRGEKCMRLWNLVTGKKAGVLTFTKDMLSAVGETRFSTGEGKSVVWDPEGEEFAVAFERGVVVFGIDCVPKTTLLPSPRTKVHKLQYLPSLSSAASSSPEPPKILLVSTEDGRILLYNTSSPEILAQIAGPAAGLTSRIKDFDILTLPPTPPSQSQPPKFLIPTGSSDGTVHLWTLDTRSLLSSSKPSTPATTSAKKREKENEKEKEDKNQNSFTTPRQTGHLIGLYATQNRITCLRAFEMVRRGDDQDADFEAEGEGGEDGEGTTSSSSSSSSDNDDDNDHEGGE